MKVQIIGAGLAGSEAAWYLANQGIKVDLYEQKPVNKSPAHQSNNFAELVCSNSLRSNDPHNAVGLLKEEMERFDSLIIEVAHQTKVPAGSALAVDRDEFSRVITEKIKNHPNITISNQEVKQLDLTVPCIVATGPLTSESLLEDLKKYINEDSLYFFDAAAPVITKESIDFDKVYLKSRYDKGEASYLNAPLTEEEFAKFYNYLISAPTTEVKEFELKVFEGCMPVEEMAKRGPQTLLYGPMKPRGLRMENGITPYGVVQLRQDNLEGSLYNIVGFQTHLKWSAQKELMKLIPGLENAEIVRYGVMHKNTYINSRLFLNEQFKYNAKENLYFAGQITGVEGYVESAASGIMAAFHLLRELQGKPKITFPQNTAFGALSHYITHGSSENFQPMNVTYGLMEQPTERVYKKERKEYYHDRAAKLMDEIFDEI